MDAPIWVQFPQFRNASEHVGMEAKPKTLVAIAIWIAGMAAVSAPAADFRTRNFIVQAPSDQLAEAVGRAAEQYRDELAVYWTGQRLPPWPTPCPIRVVAGNQLAAQGVTTYNPAPVRDFQMEVIGTPERILDSVLPHEVTHTVLATHFGRPLPRWADEGICTTVEHASEKAKHEAKLREFLSSRRGIAMNRLFLLTEYPADVLPMYAQGYSVCRFLIDQKGPRTFIRFLGDYMRHPSWTANVQKHYDYESLAQLQDYWLRWVESGSGDVTQFVKTDRSTPNIDLAIAADASPNNRIAPATAQLGLHRGDRGSDSWYGRGNPRKTASPASDQLAGLDAGAAASNAITPIDQGWTPPPSVLSAGRYSASQPQGETLGGNDLSPSSIWR